MALLSREAILAKQDILTKDVEVPEWGGTVRVRSMTVAERNEFAKKDNDLGLSVWLVALLSIDEKGVRLFRDEDVEALQKKNPVPFDRVLHTALSLNGVTKEKIDEAEKN